MTTNYLINSIINQLRYCCKKEDWNKLEFQEIEEMMVHFSVWEQQHIK